MDVLSITGMRRKQELREGPLPKVGSPEEAEQRWREAVAERDGIFAQVTETRALMREYLGRRNATEQDPVARRLHGNLEELRNRYEVQDGIVARAWRAWMAAERRAARLAEKNPRIRAADEERAQRKAQLERTREARSQERQRQSDALAKEVKA
jgi:hypothetical protein